MTNYVLIGEDGYVLCTASGAGYDNLPGWVEINEPLPAQPSPFHRLHWATMAWIDPRSFASLKSDKHREINLAWEAASVGAFEFGGKLIDCSRSSRSDIDGVQAEIALTGALPAGFPGQWKAQDNSWVPIPDAATWTQFIQAMVAQGLTNFGKAQALKAQIDAAESAQDLDGIVW